MRHPTHTDELFEILGNELRSVVGDDPRCRIGTYFASALKNDLDVGFFHRFADLPMHDIATCSIQSAAQVVKRAGDVDVGNVHMPMFVWSDRLLKARPFA